MFYNYKPAEKMLHATTYKIQFEFKEHTIKTKNLTNT